MYGTKIVKYFEQVECNEFKVGHFFCCCELSFVGGKVKGNVSWNVLILWSMLQGVSCRLLSFCNAPWHWFQTTNFFFISTAIFKRQSQTEFCPKKKKNTETRIVEKIIDTRPFLYGSEIWTVRQRGRSWLTPEIKSSRRAAIHNVLRHTVSERVLGEQKIDFSEETLRMYPLE